MAGKIKRSFRGRKDGNTFLEEEDWLLLLLLLSSGELFGVMFGGCSDNRVAITLGVRRRKLGVGVWFVVVVWICWNLYGLFDVGLDG